MFFVINCDRRTTHRVLSLVKTFNSKIGSLFISQTINICKCIGEFIGSWCFWLPSSALTSNCPFYINLIGCQSSRFITFRIIGIQIPPSSFTSRGIVRRT